MPDEQQKSPPPRRGIEQPPEEKTFTGIPNDVSMEEAIKALTVEAKNISPTVYVENGVYIINYCVDNTKPGLNHPAEATDIKPLGTNPSARTILQDIFNTIETVANVKFREVKPGAFSHITYFQGKTLEAPPTPGRIPDPPAAGYTYPGTVSVKWREGDNIRQQSLRASEIMISETSGINLHVLTHETLHGLGLSHPEASGRKTNDGAKNPKYNMDGTALSYNPGSLPAGLGAFDVAALQAVYGKPKPEEAPKVVREPDLFNKKFLFAQKPVTIDLCNPENPSGIVVIDMEKEIIGELGPNPTAPRKPIYMRLTPGTKIENVDGGDGSQMAFTIIGNELPNRIQGGGARNRITPRGGKDVLSGTGDSHDTYILDKKSGFDNVITNLDFMSDRIVFGEGIHAIELRRRDDFPFQGARHVGTDVLGKDVNGNPLASIFVVGIEPETMKACCAERPEMQIITIAPTLNALPHPLPPGPPGQTKDSSPQR